MLFQVAGEDPEVVQREGPESAHRAPPSAAGPACHSARTAARSISKSFGVSGSSSRRKPNCEPAGSASRSNLAFEARAEERVTRSIPHWSRIAPPSGKTSSGSCIPRSARHGLPGSLRPPRSPAVHCRRVHKRGKCRATSRSSDCVGSTLKSETHHRPASGSFSRGARRVASATRNLRSRCRG